MAANAPSWAAKETTAFCAACDSFLRVPWPPPAASLAAPAAEDGVIMRTAATAPHPSKKRLTDLLVASAGRLPTKTLTPPLAASAAT